MQTNCTPTKHLQRIACLLTASFLAFSSLTGCIVAGRSSTGGWFIWPGGLGLLVIVLIALFLMRGRR